MPNTITFNNDYPDITESLRIYNEATGLIPNYTQTLAKGPGQHVFGVAPIYLKSGKGSHVIDVDGNEFIDYTMGVGPLSLGYCYPRIDEAIKRQLEDGITFSLMHPLEVKLAQLIREVVPNAESVRYAKSGNEATTAAVRLARAFTGKNTILCCGYHGSQDWYICVTDWDKGIPEITKEYTYTFNYNDLDSVLNSIDDDTAAIILEPVVFEEPQNDFLQQLRVLCTERNIVLIFDEMWTGFRMALGGAQEYFGIKADLAVFSKAVANGMPISIVTGRNDIMKLVEKEVFFYNTFGGEALSLAAAYETIQEMKEREVPKYLNEIGYKLKKGINDILAFNNIDYVSVAGYNFRTMLSFNVSGGNPLEMKSFVQQELLKRGILWGGYHNMSYSHSQDDISYTLQAYNEVLTALDEAVQNNAVSEMLKGEVLKAVFRKVTNFNTKPKNN